MQMHRNSDRGSQMETAHQAKLLRCAAAFWERICFDLDLFRGMVESVFPEVGLGLAGDPLAQEIA